VAGEQAGVGLRPARQYQGFGPYLRTAGEPAEMTDEAHGRGRRTSLRRAAATAALVAALGSACGDGGGGRDGVAEPELRRELLAMQDADQAERTGQASGPWNDLRRSDRLSEIIEEHGWPGHELVGEDGASAAWVIAQHSDLDVALQEEALELMRAAVDEGDADATELAYLEDRVALNNGEPQIYGTQIGCVDGRAEPAELDDPDRVDERRRDVGLDPLADYLAELEPDCAAEAPATRTTLPADAG
jgi:hypothetical protein